jgi:hypothetical protein
MRRTSKQLSGSLLARKDAPPPATPDVSLPHVEKPARVVERKPIALTLKVDQVRYEALKTLGARTRRSNQEILLAALDAYLKKEGPKPRCLCQRGRASRGTSA